MPCCGVLLLLALLSQVRGLFQTYEEIHFQPYCMLFYFFFIIYYVLNHLRSAGIQSTMQSQKSPFGNKYTTVPFVSPFIEKIEGHTFMQL
ncbi:hypothetical protein AOLI_G00151410 [Acnodon oligacanthus]